MTVDNGDIYKFRYRVFNFYSIQQGFEKISFNEMPYRN